MNQRDEKNVDAVAGEAEATLRLIAGLPAPAGLEDRVKAGVRGGATSRTRALLEWPLGAQRGWMQNSWLRGAAAAAIVAIVAGGSWQVYSRVQPKQAQLAIPHVTGASGGFASANAVRTPKTLDVPVVPQAAKPKNGSNEQHARPKNVQAKAADGANVRDGVR